MNPSIPRSGNRHRYHRQRNQSLKRRRISERLEPRNLLAGDLGLAHDLGFFAESESNSETIVEIRLEAADTSGNPINQIEQGDSFLLRAFVEDARVDAQGVFGAYFDVTYDAPMLSASGPISYGADYPNLQLGDISVDGLVDEVGAVDGFTPLGPGEFLLFSLPMTADEIGLASFLSDPADDPANEVLVFGLDEPIGSDQVDYGSLDLLIVPGSGNDNIVDIRLQPTDLLGNPISQIEEGDVFLLSAFVEDVRQDAQGVFSAYIDVQYDAPLLSVDGLISYGSSFPNLQLGDTSTDGLIDEVGAIDGLTPLGPGEFLLFSVPMIADEAGAGDVLEQSRRRSWQ